MMDPYVPNSLLSRLVGVRMYEVVFVLNDYVQFLFDGSPQASTSVTLSSYTWPVVEFQEPVMPETISKCRGLDFG